MHYNRCRLYLIGIYADDIAITTNNVKEANILLNSLEKTAKEIGLHINVAKTEYMAYNQNSTYFYFYFYSLDS